MRLIDANLLRAEFTGNFSEMWHYTGIWAMIDCAPTAYDIDDVVERLEELKDTEQDDSVAELISTRIWNKAISKAIEIVKGGAE